MSECVTNSAEMNSKFYYSNSCDQSNQLIDYSLSAAILKLKPESYF